MFVLYIPGVIVALYDDARAATCVPMIRPFTTVRTSRHALSASATRPSIDGDLHPFIIHLWTIANSFGVMLFSCLLASCFLVEKWCSYTPCTSTACWNAPVTRGVEFSAFNLHFEMGNYLWLKNTSKNRIFVLFVLIFPFN